MEVDEEVESELFVRFGSMQTEDRSESIKQMRRLVGGENALSESKAQFYLEMSNWNVHSAVGYYFDLEASQDSNSAAPGAAVMGPEPLLPQMTFVSDVTIGEGESVPPATSFVKTWAVRNPGGDAWPPGCVLKLVSGNSMGVIAGTVSVASLAAGACTHISIQMKSPDEAGIYEAQWRMCTPRGAYFGDPIWCILTVEASGTMALTQQLNATSLSNQNLMSLTGPPRPTSPTDAHVSMVSVRNVLTMANDKSGTPHTRGEIDDEEMD